MSIIRRIKRFGRKEAIFGASLAIGGLLIFFLASLRPAEANVVPAAEFTVREGEGFLSIVNRLESENLIRSNLAVKIFVLSAFEARELKPGTYTLNAHMPATRIVSMLIQGPERETAVSIPEGATVYDIDKILSDENIIKKGELVQFKKTSRVELEGRLFPDTYHFYFNSKVEDVVAKMLKNFNDKAAPLLGTGETFEKRLIIASILEKEAPNFNEQRVIAGIIEKRMNRGMPLQVDATLCYIKKIVSNGSKGCYPITQTDLQADSDYNTYVHTGLPQGPIANPGLSAIKAAISPKSSPYWFYLADPATGKTIFSDTLDIHNANRVKYLLNS